MIKVVFEVVVTVAFQSVFCLEIHQNIFFYFLKFIVDINTLKRYKIIIFFKKNSKIFFFKEKQA
jgi:hypothetical protein